MSIKSPYKNLPVSKWEKRTRELVQAHPLHAEEIVAIVLLAWEDISNSSIGRKPFHIGKDIFPKPQIISFLLHELIPLELMERYPKLWRGERVKNEKDLVYLPDEKYSVEIKASSHPSKIFGNRSYAQKSTEGKKALKSKSGYYLAINFEAFGKENKTDLKIVKIRFGWLDHEDWTGQTAATGQQASLSPDVEKYKLLHLFPTK